MSQKAALNPFRTRFKMIDKDVVHWFPGHMNRGLKQMQQKLRSVDCIVEVHDARIPFSGRNSLFKQTVSGIKPHVLVLNKVDLIENKFVPKIKERLKGEFENIIFTNCKDRNCVGVKTLFPLVQQLIKKSNRYNRNEAEDSCLMIIGIPNVGKSSLINTLRNIYLHKANATAVGASPGITRSVLNKIKLSEDPLFYMYDTPGVLMPSVESTESGLKLALCNTIQDHLVGENIIADFLLYKLNALGKFDYVKYFGLDAPSDDILEVLMRIAVKGKHMLRIKDINTGRYVYRPNLDIAAQQMIKAFRNGDLGKILLDEEELNS